jgi:hypothetical protein
LEKRSLIQRELWSWAKDDARLAPTVGKMCSLLEQLSNREQNAIRSRRMAKKAIETINLYDSDEEETFEPQIKKQHNGPIKSNEPIEIDLSDDDDEEKKDKRKAVKV